VLQNCSQLQIDGHTVRLSYARKGQSDRHHHHQRQPYNVANAALEQAQWASQNQATGTHASLLFRPFLWLCGYPCSWREAETDPWVGSTDMRVG